jgi:hypothetical protein
MRVTKASPRIPLSASIKVTSTIQMISIDPPPWAQRSCHGYPVNVMASSPVAARCSTFASWHLGPTMVATAEVGAMMSNDRRMLTGAGKGLVAGAVGVAVMTLAEKVEQAFTHRPNSFVPAHTLERLLGALRGVMAEGGLRGPWASAMFTVVRLTADQTQENITGVGAPPWTWPRNELLIDLLHKGVYGFTTGVVADRLALPEPVWVQARRDRSDPLHHRGGVR